MKALKARRSFIAVLFVALVLFALISGGRLLFRKAEIAMPSFFRPASPSRLLMSMDGFRFVQYESGKAPWRMEARQADLYENKEARLRDIEIEFKSADERTVTLLGEEGTLDTESGNAAIHRGNRDVRVVTSDGYLMTTASLLWESGERLVRTADPFKLLGARIYLEGKGLSADTELREISVDKHVKAVLQE
jgi:lipopolysaccharide export system protein LptC